MRKPRKHGLWELMIPAGFPGAGRVFTFKKKKNATAFAKGHPSVLKMIQFREFSDYWKK